jgi:hypothetical protein
MRSLQAVDRPAVEELVKPESLAERIASQAALRKSIQCVERIYEQKQSELLRGTVENGSRSLAFLSSLSKLYQPREQIITSYSERAMCGFRLWFH